MLSILQNDVEPTFDSRCVAIYVPVDEDEGPPQLDQANNIFDSNDNHLLKCLEKLNDEAHSPLYLPFALSVFAIRVCDDELNEIRALIVQAASMTYNEVYGSNDTSVNRQKVAGSNQTIANALAYMPSVTSILNDVESL